MNLQPLTTPLLPNGTRRRRLAAKIYRHLRAPASPPLQNYQEWIARIEPTTITAPSPTARLQPLISIVVPAFNTPDKYLRPLVDSIMAQTYHNWELCLVQGGSTQPDRADAITAVSGLDERIKVVQVAKNTGIAGNTNAGLKAATGDYIAFCDHDDTLAPFALAEVVMALQHDPTIDLFYSDEDKLSDDGRRRSQPFFKPDWSPELFLSVNYLAHFVVVRAGLVRKLKGIREGYDGAQDYDFLLRLLDLRPKIHHVPHISYHWRMADGSTARAIGEKNYADDAGRQALTDYLARNKIAADVVEIPDRPTNYRLKYHPAGRPLVSIIIPFKDKVELLQRLVDSITTKTAYRHYEIILISNNSVEAATSAYLKQLVGRPGITTLEHNRPFNWSEINNFGRKQASGELLLFMNNDMEVINSEWLGELVGVAQQPGVGVVGSWLFYPNGATQHAGVVLPAQEVMAFCAFKGVRPGEWTNLGLPDWPRDYLAVTGACQMMQAKLFDKLGGFDEAFVVVGSDIVLCLKAYEQGYRNVFWPFSRLIHDESQSVGSYTVGTEKEYELSLGFYRPYFEHGDPYYNPNLTRTREDFSLKGATA